MGLFVVVALITYACTRSSSPDDGGEASGGTPSPTPEESSPSVSPSSSSSASSSPTSGEDDDDDGGGADGGADGGDGASGGGGAASGDEAAGGDSGDESGGGSDGGSGGSADYAAPEKPGDPCRPSDVVVTLKADKDDYAWDDKPKFKLTLVNTEDQTCTVDVGDKGMEIRINSGDDRVFSTADCVKGSGADKRELERGRPVDTTVTWDRARSWKQCRDRDQEVKAKRPGTYVAEVVGDYDQKADPQVFRLN